MGEQEFPASRRVKRSREFARVYQTNAFAADDVLVVQLAHNQTGLSRLGVSMSRKVGNAVVRNRWKRLVREAFRRQYAAFPAGVDVVVRPRKGARPDQRAIHASLPRLVRRALHKLERPT